MQMQMRVQKTYFYMIDMVLISAMSPHMGRLGLNPGGRGETPRTIDIPPPSETKIIFVKMRGGGGANFLFPELTRLLFRGAIRVWRNFLGVKCNSVVCAIFLGGNNSVVGAIPQWVQSRGGGAIPWWAQFHNGRN